MSQRKKILKIYAKQALKPGLGFGRPLKVLGRTLGLFRYIPPFLPETALNFTSVNF